MTRPSETADGTALETVRGRPRGYGRGTVFKRKGRRKWTGELPFIDSAGKRKHLSAQFSTEDEAHAWLDSKLSQSNTEIAVSVEAPRTVAALMRLYLLEKDPDVDRDAATRSGPLAGHVFTERTVLLRTWKDLESTTFHHVLPHIGGVALADLDVRRLTAWINKVIRTTSRKTGQPLSSDRVHYVYSTLHGALSYAVRRQWIPGNMLTAVDLSAQMRSVRRSANAERTIERGERALTLDGQARVIRWLEETYPEHPAYALRFKVAFEGGLRQGEALGLTAEKLNPQNNTLRVDQQLVYLDHAHGCGAPVGRGKFPCGKTPYACPDRKGGGGWHIVYETKTATRRDVAIDAELMESLLALATEHVEARGEVSKAEAERLARVRGRNAYPAADADLVFTNERGGCIKKVSDNLLWHRALTGAGVSREGRTVHAARHSAAQSLADLGVEIAAIASQLGHSNLSVTRSYIGSPRTALSAAAEARATASREARAALDAAGDPGTGG